MTFTLFNEPDPAGYDPAGYVLYVMAGFTIDSRRADTYYITGSIALILGDVNRLY